MAPEAPTVGVILRAWMEACAAIDEVLEATICKNLLLCNRQCTMFYLLMMPGDKVFKTKDLSAQIGSSRLSFADSRYMEEFLDITPGSLSILGLMNDKENRVQLLIDEDVLKHPFVGCHPCINTSSLRMETKDLKYPTSVSTSLRRSGEIFTSFPDSAATYSCFCNMERSVCETYSSPIILSKTLRRTDLPVCGMPNIKKATLALL